MFFGTIGALLVVLIALGAFNSPSLREKLVGVRLLAGEGYVDSRVFPEN